MVIKTRPEPPAQKELDFEIDLSQFDADDEVLRKTSQGVVDVNYIDFDDYYWTPGTSTEDDDGHRP
jgi:hypothetical protein